MDNKHVVALTVYLLFYLLNYGCHARINYNITECQECSHQNLVPCKIQVMHDNCLSAMTAIHGKQWPGPPREIQAKVTQVKNETQAQFSWKPPYDASIHSLKGFLLRITTFEDVRGTFVAGSPWCFYLNFTNSSWTESPHAYESVFQFNCVKSQYPARVTLSVSSIPRPHKGWKVVKQSVDIKGTVPYYSWKPEIYFTETADTVTNCVIVVVHPPFTKAYSHLVSLINLNSKEVQQASFKYPGNNVTLCLSPGENYSIQVRPYDKDNQPLSHNVEYSPIRIEPKLTYDQLPEKEKEKMQVMTWVVIPLVLVIVISLTVFVFYRKGILKKDKTGEESIILPNNGPDEGDNNIAIVFCAENNYVDNIVRSLGQVIRETTNSKVEVVSDNRIIEPNWKVVFVITEGIHQINHICADGNFGNCNWNRAFNSGVSFLQRIKDMKDVEPNMLLLSPIVSINWLDCCMFKNKNVPRLYQISDTEQIDLDLGKVSSFLESISYKDITKEKIRLNLNDNHEILTFKNHLLSLYLYMRDNQKWFDDDFLGCSTVEDSHQTQPLLAFPVMYDMHTHPYVDKFCLNYQSPPHLSGSDHVKPQQTQIHGLVQAQLHSAKTNYDNQDIKATEIGVEQDVFDSGISDSGIKLEINAKNQNQGRLDSGVDSMPLDEMAPFLETRPEFFPPDSDADSLDVDGQSLSQHIWEINKRNFQI
ncbi:uncharacterized protein [Mytilus edulis]|uniref:uncharacterized protein isoform X2 n=1 Tax=Mytilus edulis TaxID=6550 RepID=UPI0039EFB198